MQGARSKFIISSENELTKLTEVPFDGFVSSNSVEIKKISDITSNESFQIEMISAWLRSIQEPEEYHHIVIDKCRRDPEVLAYFLQHVNKELNHE